MSQNILEKQQLAQINQINEGLALKLLKWLMKSKVKRALKKMGRDPELKAAIADMNYHAANVKRISKEMEDEFGISF
tara:strand:+ start:126 stop:356 length:231 start_codon:yes stop_codon:yes gene_type:complete